MPDPAADARKTAQDMEDAICGPETQPPRVRRLVAYPSRIVFRGIADLRRLADSHDTLAAALRESLRACELARAFGSQGETHEGLSVSEVLRAAIARADAALAPIDPAPRLTPEEEAEAEALYRKMMDRIAAGKTWGLDPTADAKAPEREES